MGLHLQRMSSSLLSKLPTGISSWGRQSVLHTRNYKKWWKDCSRSASLAFMKSNYFRQSNYRKTNLSSQHLPEAETSYCHSMRGRWVMCHIWCHPLSHGQIQNILWEKWKWLKNSVCLFAHSYCVSTADGKTSFSAFCLLTTPFFFFSFCAALLLIIV